MSNKYLEKVASIFKSPGYRKTLSNEDRQRYDKAYQDAPNTSVSNAAKNGVGVGALSVGVGAGAALGSIVGTKLTRKLSAHVLRKDVLKGVGRVGKSNEYNIDRAMAVGDKIRNIGRPLTTAAGAIAGAVPGSMIIDRVRHNHAKGVIERKRKDNE